MTWNMRLLVVSDARGHVPDSLVGTYDAVVALGDLAERMDDAVAVLRRLASIAPVHFVVGDRDPPELASLHGKDIMPLCGAGRIGPLKAWGFCAGQGRWPTGSVHVFASHVPPLGHLDSGGGLRHMGSPEIREAVKALSPRLSLHGHVAEGWGIDMLGETILVNPGALAEGRYAAVEWSHVVSVRLFKL